MSGTISTGLSIQANVIGALIMRELHTRFGRNNIGYLWIFAEPMLLGLAVGILHGARHLPIAGGLKPIPFAIGGYVLFILFRSVVSRAESVLEANKPLLYHRQVTLFDMLAARSTLETGSTIVVLTLLLGGAWAAGFADLPTRPMLVLAAVLLLSWFSFGLGMVITYAAHESPAIARLIHPLLYLSMPLSGAFFAVDWFPAGIRDILIWVPTVPIFELLKEGQFVAFRSDHVDIGYVITWCALLTLVGLAAVRHVRRKIELS